MSATDAFPQKPTPLMLEDAAVGLTFNLLRRKHKLTLQQVSQQVGMSVSGLSRNENGKGAISFEVACKFADLVGMNISELAASATIVQQSDEYKRIKGARADLDASEKQTKALMQRLLAGN